MADGQRAEEVLVTGGTTVALNILVADDSRIARAVILKILPLTGISLGEIHQAADGREALEVISKHWIDLAFLDINMPDMDGEEVVEAVRKNPLWADLSIVVVSTEGSETRIEHLKSMGAKFVHKPYTPEIIRKVVLEITGGVHEQQA
jgi:two-component system, chemotaxis family, chemotaxis protein CheY